MATAADKADYDQKTSGLKKSNDKINKAIESYKKKIASLNKDEAADKIIKTKLKIIENLIKVSFNYLSISRISLATLKIKNENILNQARKNLYNILQHFEEIVGKVINDPLTEGKEELADFFKLMTNLEKFELFKKIGFLLMKTESLYGKSSKWKWSFVELEGRVLNALKNSIDFTTFFKNMDPSVEGYSERMELLEFLMQSLDEVAERYRNKYELTNKRVLDMKSALDFLALKKRICMLEGDQEQTEQVKRKFDSWNKKLNEDLENEKQTKVRK
ncbi:MAG TPA: hypothetical protein VKS21_03440 [Spirochaetota bacterium]|nr:hypothetical protein [Spirochaetota bacterium]